MTDSQIKKIRFRFISLTAMEDTHIMEYRAIKVPFFLQVLVCIRTEGLQEVYKVYNLEGTTYKSETELKEALYNIKLK